MSTDFDIFRREQDCIAQGCLTNSKHPRTHIQGVYPTHAKFGRGATLFDEHGRGYIDYICGLGTNLLGYGNQKLIAHISQYLSEGFSHSLPTKHEIKAAEELKSLFTWIDRVKFLKSGSEACNASLIIARAATGRKLVYSDGYHGFGGEFISLTEPGDGCLKTDWIRKLPANLEAVDFKEAAAVIVEPVITDWSDQRKEYLRDLKERCAKDGCILIFDEVITGLRFPKYSVSTYFKVVPDLIILGKALAGGLPLAAVCGKREIMDGSYFVSSTYGGEILSLEACTATCRLLKTDHEYKIDELWRNGQDFVDNFNQITKEVQIEGYPTRGRFVSLNSNMLHLFFQEACRAGLLFGPSWFFNFKHPEHTDRVIRLCGDILLRIHNNEVRLEGKPPESPFAQRVRHG